MTLLQIFNATLESLPKFSDSLQRGILQMDFWSKAKADQALSIVTQLKRSDDIISLYVKKYHLTLDDIFYIVSIFLCLQELLELFFLFFHL